MVENRYVTVLAASKIVLAPPLAVLVRLVIVFVMFVESLPLLKGMIQFISNIGFSIVYLKSSFCFPSTLRTQNHYNSKTIHT